MSNSYKQKEIVQVTVCYSTNKENPLQSNIISKMRIMLKTAAGRTKELILR